MPTPDFIVRLREHIGHELLWLVGVTAFIEDDRGRILLGRRTDTGCWALISGINEPGEEPADTIVREALEEAGVRIVPTALVDVHADKRILTYDNGDRVQYLELLYLSKLVGDADDAHVGDEESTDVGWFEPDDLPHPLARSTRERIGIVKRYRDRVRQGDRSALFRVTAREGATSDKEARA